jgi:hypothetical protein
MLKAKKFMSLTLAAAILLNLAILTSAGTSVQHYYIRFEDDIVNHTSVILGHSAMHLPENRTPIRLRAGYAFGGYFTEQNGKGLQYYDATGARIPENWTHLEPYTSDILLYAHQIANIYAVRFDKMSGIGGCDGETMVFGQQIPSPITPPVREGYDFGGYFMQLNGMGTQYYNGAGARVFNADWNQLSDMIFFAHWVEKTSNVTLDKTGGESGTDSITASYTRQIPVFVAPPVRLGFAFDGYFTQPNGEGEQFYSNRGMSILAREIIPEDDFVLYANWIADSYSVVLNKRGGSSGTDNFSVAFGEQLPADIVPPARTGFDFDGYYAVLIGEETAFYDSEGVRVFNCDWSMTSGITLVARWADIVAETTKVSTTMIATTLPESLPIITEPETTASAESTTPIDTTSATELTTPIATTTPPEAIGDSPAANTAEPPIITTEPITEAPLTEISSVASADSSVTTETAAITAESSVLITEITEIAELPVTTETAATSATVVATEIPATESSVITTETTDSPTTTTEPIEIIQPAYRLGHVLGNESVCVNDALEILKWIVGLPGVLNNCENAFNAARIIGGKNPTVTDALIILKFIVGLIEEMPTIRNY